ncbi:MAG: hypothetical protein ACUVXA_07425, partial [Candidatus Jordarchaeum sp.]|uniref:hypothetical protein n=1 Tax=Candidatus Jordarchaeum sp. TaxID=2823881 RepID=UPI004048F3AC
MSLKKKKALIICALLLLPLAGLTVSGILCSQSNPNNSLLCFSAIGYTDGSGILVKDVSVIYFNSDTEHDITQYRPPDWDISSINITLSN